MKFSRTQPSLVPSLRCRHDNNSMLGNNNKSNNQTNSSNSSCKNKSNRHQQILMGMLVVIGVWVVHYTWNNNHAPIVVDDHHRDYLLPLSAVTAGKENAHPNMDDYVDCKGQRFEELFHHFHEFGYIILLPCSLKGSSGEALMGDIIQFVDEKLPFDGSSHKRVQDGDHSSIIELGGNDEIRKVINGLYHDQHGAAFPFQTLNFKYGTQQKQHSDLIHFAGYPDMAMAAAWIALEDIHEDAGPLLVYPKSHHLPFQDMSMLNCPQGNYTCYEYAIEKYIAQQQQQKQPFLSKPKIAYPMYKGEVLIWASNFFHGGMKRNTQSPNLTRYSQVTHYLFEGNPFYGRALFNNAAKGQYVAIPHIPSYPQAHSLIERYWRPSSPWFNGHHFGMNGKAYFRPEIFHDLQGNDLDIKCPYQRS